LGALGTFSPLNILSAPTFLPLEGQPYLGPNIPQELAANHKTRRRNRQEFLIGFMGYPLFFMGGFEQFKSTKKTRHLQ
jgi:hypothetical protein